MIERRENLNGINRRLRDEELQLVGQLLTELNPRIDQVQAQIEQTNTVETNLDRYYRERLRQDLFTRKPYPDSAEAWGQLWQGLSTVPRVLWYQVRLSAESAVKAMLAADALRWLGLVAMEAALIWLLAATRRALRRARQRLSDPTEGGSFLRELIANALLLARANLLGVGVAVAITLLLWLVHVNF